MIVKIGIRLILILCLLQYEKFLINNSWAKNLPGVTENIINPKSLKKYEETCGPVPTKNCRDGETAADCRGKYKYDLNLYHNACVDGQGYGAITACLEKDQVAVDNFRKNIAEIHKMIPNPLWKTESFFANKKANKKSSKIETTFKSKLGQNQNKAIKMLSSSDCDSASQESDNTGDKVTTFSEGGSRGGQLRLATYGTSTGGF